MSSIGRVTAAQLSYWQAAFTATCDSTCTVQRNANLGSPGADGTTADSWANVPGLVNIKCFVTTPQGGVQVALAAALVDQSVWAVSVAALDSNGAQTDVRRGDRLLLSGLTLTVQHIFDPTSLSVAAVVLASAPR